MISCRARERSSSTPARTACLFGPSSPPPPSSASCCWWGLSDNVFATLVTFTTGGFFIAFSFAVLGYLRLKLGGRWQPGPCVLTRAGVPVALVAASWCILEFINVAWLRGRAPVVRVLGVVLMTVAFAILGGLVLLSVRDGSDPGVRNRAARRLAGTSSRPDRETLAGIPATVSRGTHRGVPVTTRESTSRCSSGKAGMWSQGLRGIRPRPTATSHATDRLVRAAS